MDLGRGILHRAGGAERQTKKRRGDCRIPRQLLAHMRRWQGGEYVVSWHGKPVADIGKAFDTACRRAGIEGATPHTLKHTAVTWAFQNGMEMSDAVSFFSTSAQTLERVYRQHSPMYQRRALDAIEGRNRRGKL